MDPVTGSPNAPTEEPGSAQEFNWDSDDNPYKTRFESYRSEADRRATKLSEYEQNLEDLRSADTAAQQRAAVALGIELVSEDPDPEGFVDPYNDLENKVSRLEQQLADRDIRDQARDATAIVTARLETLDLDESDQNLVLQKAMSERLVTEDGLPDVIAAAEALVARDKARLEAAMQEWQANKKAPRSIATGTPATGQKSIMEMTDNERVEWAVQRLGE